MPAIVHRRPHQRHTCKVMEGPPDATIMIAQQQSILGGKETEMTVRTTVEELLSRLAHPFLGMHRDPKGKVVELRFRALLTGGGYERG